MRFLNFILLLAITPIVHAETYYDILAREYAQVPVATPAPSYDVFARVGAPLTHYCVEVLADNKDKDHLVQIRRFTVTIDGGGDLLPPKTFEKIIFSGYGIPTIWDANHVQSERTDRDLISYHNYGSESFTLKVRQKGDLQTEDGKLLFVREKKVKKKTIILSYGYCYKP